MSRYEDMIFEELSRDTERLIQEGVVSPEDVLAVEEIIPVNAFEQEVLAAEDAEAIRQTLRNYALKRSMPDLLSFAKSASPEELTAYVEELAQTKENKE